MGHLDHPVRNRSDSVVPEFVHRQRLEGSPREVRAAEGGSDLPRNVVRDMDCLVYSLTLLCGGFS